MTKKQKTPTIAPIMDEEGFLLQAKTWTKKVACTLAQGQVLEDLTEHHWKVIDCVRQYYFEFGTIPPVRLVVRRTKSSLRLIHELFPYGYAKGVCKVSGIPQNTVKVAPMLSTHSGMRTH